MKTLNPAQLHHAYIGEGYSGESIRTWIAANIPNGDIVFQIHDVFTIDDARALTISDIEAGGRQFFIIQAGSMTHQAMHALLKLCEEPNPAVTFFFVMPYIDILPTLRSRMQVIILDDEHAVKKDVQLFMKSPIPERLRIVEPYLDALKDETPAAKQSLLSFLDDLERALYIVYKDKNNPESIKACLKAKQLLREPGNPPKQIMEMLAVSL